MSRMGTAQKLSVDQLKQAVQDGTLPAYVGIPLIQDKLKQQQEAQAGKPVPPQPPIADQILQAADQHRGIDEAQSNLPTMSAAEGGIMSYAIGGDVDSEDYEDAMQEAQDQEDLSYAQMMSDASENQGNAKEPAYVNQTPKVDFGIKPPTGGVDALLSHIVRKESGGRDYDEKGNPLTSNKGAKFAMQVLDSTAKDPGFGIKPAKDVSAEEYNRVGKELATALYGKYQDPKLAAIAYNWGAGNTDKWLASGANPAKLPKETQAYIVGANFADGGIVALAAGGAVKHFATGDPVVTDFGDVATSRAGTPLEGLQATTMDEFGNPISSAKPISTGVSSAPRTSIADLLKPNMPAGPQNPFANTPANPVSIRSLLPRNADEYTNVYPVSGQAADASYLNQLLEQAQKDPSYQPYQDEINGLLKKNPKLMDVVNAQRKATSQTEIKPTPIPPSVGSTKPPLSDEERQKRIDKILHPENVPPVPMTSPTYEELGYAPETTKAPTEQSAWDKYLQGITQEREDLKSQKEEDKYLALMAAGLGTIKASGTVEPGKVHTALGDISTGGMEGVAYYANAAKQRAAQQAALNKELGLGMYRQEIAKATAGNKGVEQALSRDRLNETIRANDLKEREFNIRALDGIDAHLRAQWSKDNPMSTDDEVTKKQKQDSYVFSNLNFRSAWKRAHPDDPLPDVSGGNVQKFDKDGNPIK